MSTPSYAAEAPRPRAPAAHTRPFFWSLRREVWEHPALYAAPLTVAGLILVGFLISCASLPQRFSAGLVLDPAMQAARHAEAYHFTGFAIMLTSIVVGLFYSLGALFNERRDRSILFWKSLPVSDLTTVAAKACVPLVVLPVFAFAIATALQLIMLAASTVVLAVNRLSPASLWSQLDVAQNGLLFLYSLAVVTLWYAPIYAWALLVSGWAKRAPFLWAVLPPLALCLVEKMAFGTSHAGGLLMDRLGGFSAGFSPGAFTQRGVVDPLSRLDPARLVSSPSLWAGLVVAAVFLAAAVWLRRRREPI